jgi:hypothetical protein
MADPPSDRDRIADDRDEAADQRELDADQRDRKADERDRQASARDQAADDEQGAPIVDSGLFGIDLGRRGHRAEAADPPDRAPTPEAVTRPKPRTLTERLAAAAAERNGEDPPDYGDDPSEE